MADPAPRIWALLGAHRGDNNQVIALAEALGEPYERKMLVYNALRRLDTRLLGASLRSLDDRSRASVRESAPAMTISIGHRSVPVVRAIRARSGGRTRSVHLGNPRVAPHHFDLVITTPQYPVPDAANVMRIPVALGGSSTAAPPSEAAMRFLAVLPRPLRLLLLGGPSRYWTLRADEVARAIATLLDDIDAEGGALVVLGSPRTPADALSEAARAIAGATVPAVLAPVDGPPSYAELLFAADRIFVTADSVSMISEALRTGKPLGLVPIRNTWFGRLWMSLMDLLRSGKPVHPRDLRFFWRELERRGLAGTLRQPSRGGAPDVLAAAAARVRQLLEPPARPATNDRDSDRPAGTSPA